MTVTEKPRVRINKHGLMSDGFTNVVAGIGAANAKTQFGGYVAQVDSMQADNAYRTSTWYGKILTIPADDAVKEWRKWNATKEQIELIEDEEKRLHLKHKLHLALLMSRHEGGALIVPGGLPGANPSPLNLDEIQPNSIEFIHVLSRDEVTPGPIARNPMSKTYGQPEWWEVRTPDGSGQIRLHGTRAVAINGRHVPGGHVRRQEFWGDSIWMHLADAVIAADAGHAIISALMHEAKIDVVSVPDMAAMMASPEGEQSMTRRWQIAAQLKSVSGIMLIDGGPSTENAKEETWNQKQMRWDGLSDVMRTILTILSGAADIPYTRLTGDQQKGLSNNDEGSMRNYYAAVNTQQVLHIEPMLRPLDAMVRRSALGAGVDDKKIWYTWSPLYQVSSREHAETEKMQAETVEIYQRTALVPDEALATGLHNRMVESGQWPGLEEALEELPEDWEAGIPKVPPAPEGAFGDPAAKPAAPAAARPAADAAPSTLYVWRDVLNWREIESWAKNQGVETTLGSDMHVTIAFSRRLVDWMSIPAPWESKIELPEGGPRMLDQFGNANVILFRAGELEWRHQAILEAGASWDHAGYQPHITFTYSDVPEKMEPYRGRIVLGPEFFSEVNEKWAEKLQEDGLW